MMRWLERIRIPSLVSPHSPRTGAAYVERRAGSRGDAGLFPAVRVRDPPDGAVAWPPSYLAARKEGSPKFAARGVCTLRGILRVA
eukprot:gene9026-biopygen1247